MKEKFIRTVYKIPGELGNESKSDVAMLKLIQLIGGDDRKELRFTELPGVILEYFENDKGANFFTPNNRLICGRALFYGEGFKSLTSEQVSACLKMCNGEEAETEEEKEVRYYVTVTQQDPNGIGIKCMDDNTYVFDDFREAEKFAEFAKEHSAGKIEQIKIELEPLTIFKEKEEEKEDSEA